MVSAALKGDWATARALNRKFFRLMQAHFWEASPAPVKATMKMLGLLEENLRLPMVPVTEATREGLRTLLNELGLQSSV
jgi:4-hydroxy-tetrahydrodipicolinate synthase